MKTRPIHLKPFIVFLAMALMFPVGRGFAADREPGAGPHVLVKISRLNDALELIDAMASEWSDPSRGRPSAMLRGMIHGTDWIDPDRLIVIGVDLTDETPRIAALIPYRTVNETFEQAYAAKAGADYYLFPLPPGAALPAAGDIETKLVAASTSEAESLITAEIEAYDILQSQRGMVDAMLAQLDAMEPPAAGGAGKAFTSSPEQTREMMRSLIDALAQVKTLSLGVDITREKVSLMYGASPMPGAELESIFRSVGDTTLFNDYKPNFQFNFKSRSFDCEGVFDMFNDIFGDYYARMGMDISPIVNTMGYYTGEFAGGASFGKAGMEFELLSVLKDGDHVKDFAGEVYIPSMLNYMASITEMVENRMGRKLKPFYVRTPDSMVGGFKVVGLKSQPPIERGPGDPLPNPAAFDSEMRLTTVGNVLIMAHDDERIEALIQDVDTFKEKKARGPLMRGDMDFSSYMSSMVNAIPELTGEAPSLPKLGRMKYVSHMTKDRGYFKFTISMDDIKALAAFSNEMKAGGAKAKKPAGSKAKKRKMSETGGVTVKDAAYWFDRGSMCMIAGNDKGAIRNLKEALKLDPDRSEVHYHLGVAYGNIGEYEKAHTHNNQALTLGTEKGLYHYARGRVHLLAGDDDKARSDFETAADLQNQDARNYLRSATGKTW